MPVGSKSVVIKNVSLSPFFDYSRVETEVSSLAYTAIIIIYRVFTDQGHGDLNFGTGSKGPIINVEPLPPTSHGPLFFKTRCRSNLNLSRGPPSFLLVNRARDSSLAPQGADFFTNSPLSLDALSLQCSPYAQLSNLSLRIFDSTVSLPVSSTKPSTSTCATLPPSNSLIRLIRFPLRMSVT